MIDATGQTLGEQFLRIRGIFVDKNWYWIGVAALLGYMFLFNILFVLFLEWLDREFFPPSPWSLLSGQRGRHLSYPVTCKTALGKGQATISEEALKEKEANRTGANIELEGLGSARSTGSVEIKREGTRKKGMVLPFTPLSLTFDNVKYSVDVPQVKTCLSVFCSARI